MGFDEYRKRLIKALEDPRIALAIGRAIDAYRRNTGYALSRYPHTIELAKEVRAIKEGSVSRWEDLLKQAMDAIEEHGGYAYFAKSTEDARSLIGRLVGREKVVVKAKSITCEEVGLREHLESLGNVVWETDLGELIVQLMNEEPMHILSPAIHVPREEVARLFSKAMGREVKPSIPEEVSAARDFLREAYMRADIGISGANVVASDTGSLIIIENEGNARLCTGLPPMHIALVGIEKLVPTLSDGMKVAEVTWRYAQYSVPSYLSLISGPSKTGDIEKETTYGAHGPRELHVIFLDNGRSEMARDPVLREALYCLRCGGCLYECPVFSLVGGRFGSRYFIGYGSAWVAYTEGFEEALPIAYTCLRCGRCKERCPVGIDGGMIALRLRELAMRGSRHGVSKAKSRNS